MAVQVAPKLNKFRFQLCREASYSTLQLTTSRHMPSLFLAVEACWICSEAWPDTTRQSALVRAWGPSRIRQITANIRAVKAQAINTRCKTFGIDAVTRSAIATVKIIEVRITAFINEIPLYASLAAPGHSLFARPPLPTRHDLYWQ